MTAIVTQGHADSLHLPDSTVDLIITSPPYFSLRSYQDGGGHYEGQIGAEASPSAYLDRLIDCTREWMRVLKPSGSLFLNLGDKYGPTKSLGGLPWRYAIRCMDELGLILRAELIWAKPNGLPESVKDRVRRSHETWFHFTLQPQYFAAVDEIREPTSVPGRTWEERKASGVTWTPGIGTRGTHLAREAAPNSGMAPNPLGKLPGSVWDIATQPLRVPAELGIDHFAAFPMEWPRRIVKGWSPVGGVVLDPFGGTGTTALVASVHGRVGISVDLSADYCRLAQWRTNDPAQRERAARVPKKAS